MPFKVVQIIENGKAVLVAVPSQWEENNILYWPNNKSNKLTTLLQDEFSVPNKEKWDNFSCIIKRQGLKSIMDAEHEIDVMELMSDTEEEEISDKCPQKKRACGTRSNISYFNAKIFFDEVSNNGASSNAKLGQNNVGGPSEILDHLRLNQKRDVSLMQADDNFVILNENSKNWNDPTNTNRPLLEQILSNQNTIIAQQAKLQTSLDTLTSLIVGNPVKQTTNTIPIPEKKDDWQSFKPIESPTELDDFEQKLNDPSFLKSVISNMSLICGKSGKSNGIDSCYMLIDYFLTREFVFQCSWTGQAKNTEQKKTPLKFYKNFRKCFFNIILLADKDFNEVDCDTFFKRVLKNSAARKTKKYESKHKRRPSNLSYSKKSKSGLEGKEKKDNCQTDSEKNGLSDQETSNDNSKPENNADDLSDKGN